MTTRSIYELAQTWNNGAVDFDAISVDVTNTASGSGSKLLNLKIGGSSRFNVSSAVPATRWIGGTDHVYGDFFISTSNATFLFSPPAAGGAPSGGITYGGIFVAKVGFYAGATDPALAKTRWIREADDVWGMYRDVNPQTINIYNSRTDASNYERLKIGCVSNVFTIAAEAAGTGTKRNVVLDGANRAAYNGSPTTTDIRDILISHGLMAAS